MMPIDLPGVRAPFVFKETTFTNPAAPSVVLPAVFPAAGTAGPSTIALPLAVNPDLQMPYSHQWNATVEHERWNTGFRVSYVGTLGREMWYTRDVNAPEADGRLYVDKPRPFPQYPRHHLRRQRRDARLSRRHARSRAPVLEGSVLPGGVHGRAATSAPRRRWQRDRGPVRSAARARARSDDAGASADDGGHVRPAVRPGEAVAAPPRPGPSTWRSGAGRSPSSAICRAAATSRRRSRCPTRPARGSRRTATRPASRFVPISCAIRISTIRPSPAGSTWRRIGAPPIGRFGTAARGSIEWARAESLALRAAQEIPSQRSPGSADVAHRV